MLNWLEQHTVTFHIFRAPIRPWSLKEAPTQTGRVLLSSSNFNCCPEPNLPQLLHCTLLLPFCSWKAAVRGDELPDPKAFCFLGNYKELPSYRIAQRKPEYFTLLHRCLCKFFFQWNQKNAMNFLKATQQIIDIIKNQNLEPFFVALIYATASIRLISICWEVKAMLSWN